MDKPYRLERFELGPFGTNLYLLSPGGHEQSDSRPGCTLVDAGFGVEAVLDEVTDRGLTLDRVVLTHAHIDHIAGLPAVRDAWPDAPVFLHPAEAPFLTDPAENLSAFMGEAFVCDVDTQPLRHGDTLALTGDGTGPWEVRHTPGHSPGGVALIHAEACTAIVGDTLFANSIGRSDFPHSSHADLIRSIREQLFTLPDNTEVHPGHGPETTVGQERATNPFLLDA